MTDSAGAVETGVADPRPVATQRRSFPTSNAWRLLGVVGPGVVVLVVLAMIGITRRDAWMDEACSMAATVQPVVVFRKTAGTMIAYYAVLYGWVLVSDSLWWIRFLSVLFAAAAVVVTGWVALRIRGAAVARWACLLLAVSYTFVHFAREARSFTMVVVVVGGTWLALDKIVEGGPRRNLWTLVHFGLAALVPLVHGLAIIALLAQPLALAVSRVRLRACIRVLPSYLASLAVIAYLLSMGASDVGAGDKFTFEGAKTIVLRLHGGYRWSGATLFDLRLLMLAATVYGASLATVRWWRSTTPLDRFRSIAPVVWGLGTLVGFFILNTRRANMIDRYVIAAIPALAILQADAAFHAQRTLARALRVSGRWATAPIVAVVLVGALSTGQFRLNQGGDRTWSEMTEIVVEDGRDGDGIFVPRGAGRMMFDYAWSQQEGNLPALVSVGPVHELGVVQRFNSRIPLEESIELIEQLDRVWLIKVPLSKTDEAFDDAVLLLAATEQFELQETHAFWSGSLYLLERK